MYSGHGLAEWTNSSRAVTIETTKDPAIFEFRMAKRGAYSGWERNEDGA